MIRNKIVDEMKHCLTFFFKPMYLFLSNITFAIKYFPRYSFKLILIMTFSQNSLKVILNQFHIMCSYLENPEITFHKNNVLEDC